MASSVPLSSVIFLFLLYPGAPTFSNSLPISPLAFKCSPPRHPPPAFSDIHLARSLLGALAGEASHAGFAASDVATAGGDRLHGLTQCRPDLHPAACVACLSAAADAMVSSLCMGSPAAAGWFVDGCYLHYYYGSGREDFLREARPFEARSNGTYAHDGRADLPPAAGALLRRLVAGAALPSNRGFSHGEASYGRDGGGRVYAAAECLRSLPPERCRACLAGAAAMARACCGRTEGGLAVAGDCTVRFESRRFLSDAVAGGHSRTAGAAATSAAVIIYDEDDEGDGSTGLKGRVVLLAWLAAVACLVVVAAALWLLRRRILSVKVAAATFPEDTEEGVRESK